MGIGTIDVGKIFVVKSMRDCISVSGRWFYGLFEEIVDLFTIKSTGNPKLTSSALGAFILIDDWLVGRLNDGTLCRLWSLFGLKIFFHYIPIVFYYGGFGITLTVDLFINIFFVKYNHSMVQMKGILLEIDVYVIATIFILIKELETILLSL